ncbi:MAG: hypothetical protein PXY39_13820 [archaeon]|nr:hypothetical protein [archaeon]
MRYTRPQASSKSLTTKDMQRKKHEKLARMRVYSCVFCEFIQTNLFEIEESEKHDLTLDRAFEAKYLFHLRTVHGLEK